MRNLLFTAAMAVAAVPFAAEPAFAQSAQREYQRDVREAQRDCARDLRRADSRREVREERRECREDMREARQEYRQNSRRDWRQYRNYDYNRYERGSGAYYADAYYRDGRDYRERRLSARDRIYRGRDGRYYCRRSDGTTGLIVGAAIGGLLGNALNTGRSSTFETILGAGAGGLLGREISRGSVRCR
jgi:uncharacterized protein YcfJ